MELMMMMSYSVALNPSSITFSSKDEEAHWYKKRV